MRISITDKYNAITFRESLITVPPVLGYIRLILGKARYHHASILNELIENNGDILLVFLPNIQLNSMHRKDV